MAHQSTNNTLQQLWQRAATLQKEIADENRKLRSETGRIKRLKQKIEVVSTCPYCLERMNDTNDGIWLSCGHTICSKCMDQVFKDSEPVKGSISRIFKCPVSVNCKRAICGMSLEDIKKQRKNFQLNNLY